MTTFAIIAPQTNSDLTTAVEKVFGSNQFEFSPGQFVAVSDNLTTQGVYNAIAPENQLGQIVVFAVAGHWGFHKKQLWEWLTAKGGAA